MNAIGQSLIAFIINVRFFWNRLYDVYLHCNLCGIGDVLSNGAFPPPQSSWSCNGKSLTLTICITYFAKVAMNVTLLAFQSATVL